MKLQILPILKIFNLTTARTWAMNFTLMVFFCVNTFNTAFIFKWSQVTTAGACVPQGVLEP